MEKKLYRSRTDKKLCGVCGGLAKYFGIDASLIRLAVVLLSLFVGGGVIVYIVCALIVPEEPENIIEEAPAQEPAAE